MSEEREVGRWNFCPHCARPLMPPEYYQNEDQDSDGFDYHDIRCSCCDRPWIACPCTPASEGECKAVKP